MSYRILSRIVHALALVTGLTLIAAKTVEYGGGRVFGAVVGSVARWVSVWPLIACALFALLQGIPGGRKIVTSPWSRGGDAWPLILVLLMAIPSTEAERLVPSNSGVGSSEFTLLTLATILMCMTARITQLHIGAKLGVTRDDDNAPMIH